MPTLHKTKLSGLLVLESAVHKDFRGSFSEAWNARELERLGVPFRVDQVNVSESIKPGTIRGMHWQDPNPQAKIVRCIRGQAMDVAVDVRKGSETYGEWVGIRLTAGDAYALLVPAGFAHGWQALEPFSAIEYLTEGYWEKGAERGVSPLNRMLDIRWPLAPAHVLDRDLSWPALEGLPS